MTQQPPSPAAAGVELYPHRHEADLDPALFADPPAEYRGTPLWSWNNALDPDQLCRQLDDFKRMGFGGAHMHVRTGLATPYLSDEFMRVVRACVDHCRDRHMLAWLYDEDRWPSGAAGGIVTRQHAYRARHLLFTIHPYEKTGDPTPAIGTGMHCSAQRSENGELIARYALRLDTRGDLAHYRRLAANEQPKEGETLWFAYLETAPPNTWFNNQTYVDTLNPEAIGKFIEVTHEAYRQAIGDAFGNVTPAIFTDEPQFAHSQRFSDPRSTDDLIIPYTNDFEQTFRECYGQSLLDHLPELFWELPGGEPSPTRYRFHDHLTERFTRSFSDQIGTWCAEHNLLLTGHMMEEPTLHSQTRAIGEAMRAYRGFQLPGIDMLCDDREYNTAKQAQSAAHQFGRPGVLSELYGVTNWDFDFVGHKVQGDWQAALGVTVRVPHLAWVSMLGEAKRDYPASIQYQSPWFDQYPVVENHFARLNTVLTRGCPGVRVGVVHPIESYWLGYGALSRTQLDRAQREQNFHALTDWLLFGLIDFDFISESLLPEQCPSPANEPELPVGAMRYDVVIVPGLRTIRASTLERLEAMVAAGGQVIFAGEIPSLLDARPSDRPAALAGRATTLPFSRPRLLEALEPYRELAAQLPSGAAADTLLHQLRDDGDKQHLFICNTHREMPRHGTRLRMAGRWRVDWLDTFTGASQRLASTVTDAGATEWTWDFTAHGHLLVTLSPREDKGKSGTEGGRENEDGREVRCRNWPRLARLEDPVPVTLHEPNALLLNQATWRLNGGEWCEREELLHIEDAVRRELGIPQRFGRMAQPWTDAAPVEKRADLEISFSIQSDVGISSPSLALEQPDEIGIELDGKRIPAAPEGFYVDEAIQLLTLPDISPGAHELRLHMPMTRNRVIEWCYLLGDFGVELRGRHAKLVEPVRDLAFGDWTRQGLPFYTGNVTYHCTVRGDGGPLGIEVPFFKNPVVRAAVDGEDLGPIAFDPFRVSLGALREGAHRLDLTAYGHRFNGFGCLHNRNPHLRWFGPGAWRSRDKHWAYEYNTYPMGLLVAPIVRRVED